MKRGCEGVLLVMGLVLMVSCGSREVGIAGQVLVDGVPVDRGTIRLTPVADSGGNAIGCSVEGGVLQVSGNERVTPGIYRVEASAFKKTGRSIADPQRGQVEEMVPVRLSNSPQEIEITRENHDNLTLEFASGADR